MLLPSGPDTHVEGASTELLPEASACSQNQFLISMAARLQAVAFPGWEADMTLGFRADISIQKGIPGLPKIIS